ncbi:MAG: hypothetical protein ACRETC_11050, partial [Gammaproteobacteria bacterium]
ANILHHDPAYRPQIRGLTPWLVQQYIWSHCFSETRDVMTQTLIDCPSPISDQDAAAILTTYQTSPSLLDNLRTWMSTLRVSKIVLNITRKSTAQLDTEVEADQKK